jgi:hypothetical protein
MARPKKISNLQEALDDLLKTKEEMSEGLDQAQKTARMLYAKIAQLQSFMFGAGGGRNQGRKRGRKAGVKMCSVPGCGKKHYALGLCGKHYQHKDLRAKAKKAKKPKGRAAKTKAA